MRTYYSTASKQYLCAFRCSDCGKISVTTGKFSVERGGGPSSEMAQRSSLAVIAKKMPLFYERVNRDHDIGGMNASGKCTFCGKKQDWQPNENTTGPQIILTLIGALILGALFILLMPNATLPVPGMFILGAVISACFWKLYAMLARRIDGKMIQRKLQARNFDADLWPVIGDPNVPNSMSSVQQDDPRVQAILNAKL